MGADIDLSTFETPGSFKIGSDGKEFKGTFNIRIPSELHRQLSEEAEVNHITLNQYIKTILQNHHSYAL